MLGDAGTGQGVECTLGVFSKAHSPVPVVEAVVAHTAWGASGHQAGDHCSWDSMAGLAGHCCIGLDSRAASRLPVMLDCS